MVVHWWKEGSVLRTRRRLESAQKSAEVEASGAEGKAAVKSQPQTSATSPALSLAGRKAKASDNSSHWKKSIVINGIGAIATFVVLMVFIATKFIHGAWVVVLLIPLLVLMFLKIHRHYIQVAQQLSTEGLGQLRPIHHEVIVPISGIHRGVVEAL